jgi:hypothetical protein
MTTTKWITLVIQDAFAAQKWFVCGNRRCASAAPAQPLNYSSIGGGGGRHDVAPFP